MSELVRLQKYMADCGVASRRACEALIEEGRVKVDGKIVRVQGVKINPINTKVEVNRLAKDQDLSCIP
jgi:23S rRNA pseudouridine2605 synthase